MESACTTNNADNYADFMTKPTCNLIPKTATIHQIELRGNLTTGWIGRLTTGLANNSISVLRGKAEKVAALDWTAMLEIDFCNAVCTPAAIDYLALINETSAHQTAEPVKLYSFLVERNNRHHGSLYVELTGADRIGFLAAMINLFSMYSLYPAEISIETNGLGISDRFWLKGLGGVLPSESASTAVIDRLKACTEV